MRETHYCVPTLSALTGSAVSDFDWWSAGGARTATKPPLPAEAPPRCKGQILPALLRWLKRLFSQQLTNERKSKMPTYCVPTLSSLPGSPASDFDWWVAPPDPTLIRYYPDNPNWLGAFSLSEGNGASTGTCCSGR